MSISITTKDAGNNRSAGAILSPIKHWISWH